MAPKWRQQYTGLVRMFSNADPLAARKAVDGQTLNSGQNGQISTLVDEPTGKHMQEKINVPVLERPAFTGEQADEENWLWAEKRALTTENDVLTNAGGAEMKVPRVWIEEALSEALEDHRSAIMESAISRISVRAKLANLRFELE